MNKIDLINQRPQLLSGGKCRKHCKDGNLFLPRMLLGSKKKLPSLRMKMQAFFKAAVL